MRVDQTVLQLRYGPDGKRIFGGLSDGSAKVWDPTTGRLAEDGTAASVGREVETGTVSERPSGPEVWMPWAEPGGASRRHERAGRASARVFMGVVLGSVVVHVRVRRPGGGSPVRLANFLIGAADRWPLASPPTLRGLTGSTGF